MLSGNNNLMLILIHKILFLIMKTIVKIHVNCKIKKMNAHKEINVTLVILYIKLTFQLKKMILMKRHT